MKPTATSITINHKLFTKQVDHDYLNHSVYLCEETQQTVRVSWSEFYKGWNIQGCCHKNFMDAWMPYFITADSLSTEMRMPEQYIDTYLTPCQNNTLESVIHEAMISVMSKKY